MVLQYKQRRRRPVRVAITQDDPHVICLVEVNALILIIIIARRCISAIIPLAFSYMVI